MATPNNRRRAWWRREKESEERRSRPAGESLFFEVEEDAYGAVACDSRTHAAWFSATIPDEEK